MRLVPIDHITIGDRQRKVMDKTKLTDLKASILSKGLFHPIVVTPNALSEGYELTAGERRLTAITELAKEGTMFRHHGEWVEPGFVPVTYLTELSADDLFEAQFEENILREDFTWQERVKALAEIHQRRRAKNPDQTILATAQEIVDKTASSDGPALSTLRNEISDAQIVAPHLNNPAIQQARTAKDAAKIVLKQEAEKWQAELIRRKILKPSPLSVTLRCGDMLEEMEKLDKEQFDLILSDPPYGINADGASYQSRAVQHHLYNDTPENARNILRTMLTEGWRVAKLKANIVIFTDISHWDFLFKLASQMGWSPWRWPVIWQKSESEGFVPWGRSGFCHTYDIVFYATKGQRGTNKVIPDIFSEKRVGRSEKVHAAEKPVPLLEAIIDCMTLPGDTVLDPCAGSGSTLVAAKRLKRNALGIELDQGYADSAMVRIDNAEMGEGVALPAQLDDHGLPLL